MSTQSKKPESIIIFDTTLRDGEQSPGASMTHDEKIKIALMLEALGVNVIEAGFPRSSNGDFKAVHAIASVVKNSIICGLSRATPQDIARTAEAIAPAPLKRIHTFISTSPVHMAAKLKMTPKEVLEAVTSSVTYARSLCDDVEWSAEDATRTEHDFLCACTERAIKAGARTINIPDTVGYSDPDEHRALFKMIRNRVPNSDLAIFSTHCHNDLGMATANSLAGIKGGARQVECTINGLGERAGNAALEEIVMALKTRHDLMPFTTSIKTEGLTKASHMIASITGFTVQPNKAIVGANAFAHESGVHQDGMLKNRETYEIMTPESVGLSQNTISLGKLSGRNAFKTRLKEMGYDLPPDEVKEAFTRFKDLADSKKEIFDEDIEALIDDRGEKPEDCIKFVSLEVTSGSKTQAKATLELNVRNKTHTKTSQGNGPIDAAFNAVKSIVPHEEAELKLYQVKAITQGTDAQAEVIVRLKEAGRTVTGRGTDIDTIVASTKGYVKALNKLVMTRPKKIKPQQQKGDSPTP